MPSESNPQQYRDLFNFVWEAARLVPDQPALVTASFTSTFGDLYALVGSLASKMRSLGVSQGQTVGLNAPAVLHLPLMLATFSLGATSVRFTPSVLAAGQIKPDWIFAMMPFEPGAGKRQVLLTPDFVGEVIEAPSSNWPVEYAREDDLCLVVHSSGTTGEPKAIGLSAEQVFLRLQNVGHWVSELPYISTFDPGTWIYLRSFLTHLLRAKPFHVAQNINEVLALTREHGIAQVESSVQQATGFIDTVEKGNWHLENLNSIVLTGALVPLSLFERLTARLGVRVIARYGITELDIVSIGPFDPTRPGLVGQITPGLEANVLDETKELRLRAPWMATEYLGNPQATASHFEDGWFHPGDIVEIDNSSLIMRGRVKDIVNVGGNKINLSLAENHLIGLFGVRDAGGFAKINEQGSEEYWLAVTGDGLDLVEIKAHLSEKYRLTAPNQVIQVPQIPRNANGKILRSALADL